MKKTLKDLLLSSIVFLKKKKIKNPIISSEIFLSNVLKIKRNELHLYLDKKLCQKKINKFQEMIERRSKKEPIEYILGEVDFYKCNLKVNSDVLIPRQETEILVDLISKELEKENYLKSKTLFDVCTGSGAIGLALKKRFNDLTVFLSDISKKALDVAKKNAKRNKLNVHFKEGDLFTPFLKIKADFVVCNPPYVSESEYKLLDEDVKDYEPEIALIAKDSGLEFYKRIEKNIYNFLKPKAKIFLEIGHNQKNNIKKIFSHKKWRKKKIICDYSKKNRFFFVEIE